MKLQLALIVIVMSMLSPRAWSQCGCCGDIDFNNDGLYPDSQDLNDFLLAFSGAPRPN